MAQGRGGLTFRATQIITGHGCFGQYLHRIGRDDTPECRYCASPIDSAQHTLEECEAWASERGRLQAELEGGLDLPSVVNGILESDKKCMAFLEFCEVVMLRKEDAERERRGRPLEKS